ncbi:DUF5317 domain-containing protein [Phytoactinopolyspora alkaliphila]|uniref:DUF5317 domain-containing protein n=1 Tax=Phytoactinopolyspora alkaliphila TaxID=1783498 RepID=A0A6N9YQX7_9ACTN|nr:DUF5317 domain-containing protein [Phytoactinopolyspora alkaliphila]
MVLVVLALAVGLAVGYAKHGRLRRLATPPPARNRLVLTALGLHIVAVFASWTAWESALATLSALSWFVIAFYAWVNRWMPGARLVAVGLAANAAVLLANGGVPVSADAAARAGVDASAVSAGTAGATVPAESSRLSVLSKNIPVAFPPRPEVVSAGDIAVAAGLATVLATGMVGRRPATNAIPSRRRYRYTDDDLLAGDEPHGRETDGEPGRPPGDAGDAAAHATMKHRADGDTSPIRKQASA